ncbi:MAG TPA: hypothetical protein VKG78_00155, partial [Opitutaceae bacterium]|nr:hypothetical protein [Opitutaceae bacterium]
YPPPQSPWWDRFADPGRRGDLQTRFSIEIDGGVSAAHTAHFFDPTRFKPWVAARGSAGAGPVWVESFRPVPPADR